MAFTIQHLLSLDPKRTMKEQQMRCINCHIGAPSPDVETPLQDLQTANPYSLHPSPLNSARIYRLRSKGFGILLDAPYTASANPADLKKTGKNPPKCPAICFWRCKAYPALANLRLAHCNDSLGFHSGSQSFGIDTLMAATA